VDDATAKGATVVCGGATVGDMGYFFAPTLLTEVSPDALVMHEEIFGPVAPVATFATEAEAITRANDTELRTGGLCLHQGPVAHAARQ